MMELREDLIKRRSKHFDLACITLLDLSDAGIQRLAHLEDCVNVSQLNLARNEIRDVYGLPPLAVLHSLDLSDNQLSSLEDLPHLPMLEELYLSGNAISSIDFIKLASKLPRLRKLHLERNPAKKANFIQQLRLAMPQLITLNGQAMVFYEVLTQEQKQPSQNSFPVTTGATSSASTTMFQVPSFNVDDFIKTHTTRLSLLLIQANETLEQESKKVETAFIE